jgi:DNA-binding GntR family transcriptional regulator
MPSTISEQISRGLADRIMSGAILPGEKLEEQSIADEFQVSRTPVRDALRQLEGTGLVEIRPQKGAMVADIGVVRLNDMFEAMGELEALCAKLSAQRMNAIERKKIELIHAESLVCVQNDDDLAYSDANERFHDAIYDGTHNQSIKSITENFRRRLAPFRSKIFFKAANRMQSSSREHEEILTAIMAGDADRADRAMRGHVAGSSLNVIDYVTKSRAQHGSES